MDAEELRMRKAPPAIVVLNSGPPELADPDYFSGILAMERNCREEDGKKLVSPAPFIFFVNGRDQTETFVWMNSLALGAVLLRAYKRTSSGYPLWPVGVRVQQQLETLTKECWWDFARKVRVVNLSGSRLSVTVAPRIRPRRLDPGVITPAGFGELFKRSSEEIRLCIVLLPEGESWGFAHGYDSDTGTTLENAPANRCIEAALENGAHADCKFTFIPIHTRRGGSDERDDDNSQDPQPEPTDPREKVEV